MNASSYVEVCWRLWCGKAVMASLAKGGYGMALPLQKKVHPMRRSKFQMSWKLRRELTQLKYAY